MDCGILTSKSILLLLSLIFWAAGAALAYIGAYVIRSYSTFDSFIQDNFVLVPAAILISVAVLMFFFGLLGCCSTLQEFKCGLSFFFLIIMAMFAAEVAALVFSFIYQKKINGDLELSMNETFAKYNDPGTWSKDVDYLQTELQCCGIKNYTSWTNTTWFTSHNNTVPLSCCKLNIEGCEGKLESLIENVWGYAVLVILGFFFGMLSVCVITCQISNQRSGYQPFYA
uniref:Tetraspanin n=1 Tax=Cynoglossus semilaevis TaxID=244447 RepID=A0A3P8WT91_CYNSE